MKSSDDILPLIAAGDVSAMRVFMERYRGLVWSLARRVLRGSGDVEDAVQEAFIDLWKNAQRFDPGIAAEATFVATIARRRLLDHRRRRNRRPDSLTWLPIEDVEIREADPQMGGAEAVEEAARADEAISKLRPDQQAVLKLAVYEGWSHQRIAENLQMPLGTVKTHARRGLQRVREMLARKEQPFRRDDET